MNRFKYLLFIILAAISPTSLLAQNNDDTLPEPVFSDSPTTLRLVLKNIINQTDNSPLNPNEIAGGITYKNILNFNQNNTKNPLKLVSKHGKDRTYEATLNIGMTTTATFTNQRALIAERDFYIVLVPGETTTITYDVKKGTVKCKGPFSRLNEELWRDLCRNNGRYSLFNILGCKPNTENQPDYMSFDMSIEPSQFPKFYKSRCDKAYAEMCADKRCSTQFKQMWKSLMPLFAANTIHRYAAYYHMLHPDYNLSQFNDSLSKDDIQYNDLYAIDGNATLYMPDLHTLLCSFHQIKNEGVLTPAMHKVMRLRELICEMDLFSAKPMTLTQNKLATFKQTMPEYYPLIQRLNNERLALQQQQANAKEIGTMCHLDRSIEGDSVLTALMATYKGKPTFLTIAGYEFFRGTGLEDLNERYKDVANFVYVMGGTIAVETKMHDAMKMFEGNFYFVTNYQHQALAKSVGIDDNRIYIPSTYFFDAQGNNLGILSKMTGNNGRDYSKLDSIIVEPNFHINGIVSEGIGDVGYRVQTYNLKRNGEEYYIKNHSKSYIDAPDRKFSYSTYLPKPCIGELRAVFADGSICTHFVSFPFLPGEACTLKMMNGRFSLTAEKGFYDEWGRTDEFVENARKDHTAEEADKMLRQYLKEHCNEEACVTYYLKVKVLPADYILSLAPDTIKNGRLKDVIETIIANN